MMSQQQAADDKIWAFVGCISNDDNERTDNTVLEVNKSNIDVLPSTHQVESLSVKEIYEKWEDDLLVLEQQKSV